jgi:hypothetical protein
MKPNDSRTEKNVETSPWITIPAILVFTLGLVTAAMIVAAEPTGTMSLAPKTKTIRVSGAFVARNAEGDIVHTFRIKSEQDLKVSLELPADAYLIELKDDPRNVLSCVSNTTGEPVTAKRCTFLGAYVGEIGEINDYIIVSKDRHVDVTLAFAMEFEEEDVPAVATLHEAPPTAIPINVETDTDREIGPPPPPP